MMKTLSKRLRPGPKFIERISMGLGGVGERKFMLSNGFPLLLFIFLMFYFSNLKYFKKIGGRENENENRVRFQFENKR
jgi:hypothetical protein